MHYIITYTWGNDKHLLDVVPYNKSDHQSILPYHPPAKHKYHQPCNHNFLLVMAYLRPLFLCIFHNIQGLLASYNLSTSQLISSLHIHLL